MARSGQPEPGSVAGWQSGTCSVRTVKFITYGAAAVAAGPVTTICLPNRANPVGSGPGGCEVTETRPLTPAGVVMEVCTGTAAVAPWLPGSVVSVVGLEGAVAAVAAGVGGGDAEVCGPAVDVSIGLPSGTVPTQVGAGSTVSTQL